MSTTADEQHRLKDRVHFTGRHDDVDPSPGPESCADTDCMVLRSLIADLEAAVRERDEAVTALEAYPGWSDDVEEADRLHWWRLAQDALATIPDLDRRSSCG